MQKPNFTSKEKLVFERLGISAVILFGSQAIGTARDSSDFDFGILVNGPAAVHDSDKHQKVYNALYDIFSNKIGELKDIDIVFLQTVPAELQMHAIKKGKLLYEAKRGAFADFKAQIMLEYADFAPLREIFHAGILARIR